MLSLHGDAVENSCFFELWLLTGHKLFTIRKGQRHFILVKMSMFDNCLSLRFDTLWMHSFLPADFQISDVKASRKHKKRKLMEV